jgi:phage-related protein
MDVKHSSSNSINFRPSFGSQASFSADINSFKQGHNYSQRTTKGINSLNMVANLNFNQLTDEESNQLLSFLQKQFYYSPQEYSNEGFFTNKRITPFAYQIFYPYKSLNFNCLTFNHEKESFNINTVTAEFKSISPSILDSVESGAGMNNQIDAELAISGGSNRIASVSNNNVSLPKNSYIFKSGTYKSFRVKSDFIKNKDSSSTIDLDVSAAEATDGDYLINQTDLRHSIFIDQPNTCSYYPYKPQTSDGELDYRFFDYRPNETFSLQNSPKFKQSSASDIYQKYNKYGFNPNLSNLNLTFSARSNVEAKNILLFLESHLGYKKFGFYFDYTYGSNESNSIHSTPHRKKISTFYCPEWSHSFIYNDNHQISATFLECPSL